MLTQDQETADEGIIPPPNKRQRILSKACESCKLKKSKCDSSRPRCGACRRAGEGGPCIYRERGQPGLRPGYGKAIEQRLNLLEENMDRISQSVQDVLHHVRQDSAPAAQSSAFRINETETSMAGASEDDQFWQQSQQLPDIPAFSSPAPIEQLPPTPFTIPASNTSDSNLPGEEIVRELSDLFFSQIHPWFPLFHKPTFMAALKSQERNVLLHAIVVIAFRLWRKTTPLGKTKDGYVKTSREIVLLSTVDEASVVTTQALAILALDAISLGPGPRTLNIMAMLVSAAHQLRLARTSSTSNNDNSTSMVRNEDSDDELEVSSIQAEEKRRLFWVIYSLDKFSSVSHGQSTSIDTKTIRLLYPASDDSWGQTTMSEWFQPTQSIKSVCTHCSGNIWHHNIDLLDLLDRSNQLLIQPVNLSLPAHCQEWQSNFRRLDLTLSTWYENLPKEAREPPSTFHPMWIMTHATFHLINLRMYTVAAFPSTTSPYLRPSISARGRLRQSIRHVASLASSLQSHELNQLGPFFAFVVWVAARGLMILWTTGYENTYGSTPLDLEALINALKQQGSVWPCAQSYTDIIQLILDTKNKPSGTAGLEIFNDTRRTSYGLKNRLGGSLLGHRTADTSSCSIDFLDLPVLDVGDFETPGLGLGLFGTTTDGEWL